MRIKWLKAAVHSLDSAMAYVAQDDEDTAERMSEYIRLRVENLREQPYLGRTGQVNGTRELVIDKYPFIIPYRVKDGELQILDVFHTSRKPPKNW